MMRKVTMREREKGDEEKIETVTKKETQVRFRQRLTGDVMPDWRRPTKNSIAGRIDPLPQPAEAADPDFVYPILGNNPFHRGINSKRPGHLKTEI